MPLSDRTISDMFRQMGIRMKTFGALVAAMTLVLAGCGGGGSDGGGGDGGTIKVALGDIESVETLALFIALERVNERGTEVELIELADEDLANQAVVGGQADVGLGAPYALIQGSKAPLRIFCQLAGARFFPVVDKAAYPDWQALDGETFTVHSRGSTTEALAKIVEQDEGIKFGKISFVPGAEVRATALLRGNVKATVLDIPHKNYVMKESPGKFHVLPVPETKASDEVLFGNTEWLEANPETVQILLEEVLKVWRSINEDPNFVAGGAQATRPAEGSSGRAGGGAAPLLRGGLRGRLVHRRLRRRGSRGGRLRVLQCRRAAQGRSGQPEGRGLLDARPGEEGRGDRRRRG